MFSEALRMLDRNTVKYMIEQQQQEIDELKEARKEDQLELQRQVRVLNEKDAALSEKDAEIAALKKLLAGHAKHE